MKFHSEKYTEIMQLHSEKNMYTVVGFLPVPRIHFFFFLPICSRKSSMANPYMNMFSCANCILLNLRAKTK